MRARLDGGATQKVTLRVVCVRSKPGYLVRIYHVSQETLPRSLRCHFGPFYDLN